MERNFFVPASQWVHPLKGLCQEKTLPRLQERSFFLAETGPGRNYTYPEASDTFTLAEISQAVVSVIYFTAPVTHQDQGPGTIGPVRGNRLIVLVPDPFRNSRTRKSSVPDRAQKFSDKSCGLKTNPELVHGLGSKEAENLLGGADGQSIFVVLPNPPQDSPLQPTLRRRPVWDRRVPDPASRNKPLGPACGPARCGPP